MPVHAFIFPGQGSQAVGMGRDLAAAFSAAREVFEEVDDDPEPEALQADVRRPRRGPDPDREHPARADGPLARRAARAGEGGRLHLRQKAVVVAGHSLGEYSALAAAGAFSIPDAARLLKLRGQTMQRAVPAGEGAMAALLGAEMAQAEAICAEAAPVPDSETARARGHRAGQRQWRRPDRRLRPPRRGRARRRHRAVQGRAAGDAAAGLRPVPLRADGARRRCDGRGAGEHPAARADRAADRQCLRRQGHRPGGDPRPAGAAGHRHGALARMRQRDGGTRRGQLRRTGHRQGAVRADPPHRTRRRHRRRPPRRPRSKPC